MINYQRKMDKTFRYSFCEPLNPQIIEKGAISKDDIIETFEHFPWNQYLNQILNANQDEIHYSPSLEFENNTNKNAVIASVVGEPDDFEFYIFYKRPKGNDDNYMNDLTGQTKKDVIDCLNALIKNDLDFLEKKFK
jgi:hypothetical protein